MTLAYVFWHRPADPRDAEAPRPAAEGYEDALAAFHAALRDDPPPGYVASWTLRVAHPPHDDAGAAYEDWYVVAGWEALGTLNGAAVDARRRAAHDRAARRAQDGAGGVYALLRGEPRPAVRSALWLDKPRSTPYDRFLATLPAGAQAWQRQMVLGPAPEFLVVDAVARAGTAARAAAQCREAAPEAVIGL